MFDSWTVDQLEQTLTEAEQRIGRLRAMQMALLDRLDVAQVARLDGSRNLAEWVAARTDVDHHSARELVRTASTTADRPELRIRLAEGDWSFARCAATARLAATGASADTIRESAGYDIAGVRRLASRRRRFTRVDEREAFERRHLVMQSSLDDAMGRIYGEFTGYDWRLIEKAITERADSFPSSQDAERTTTFQRRADALASICQDVLDGDASNAAGSTQTRLVSVFVDARTRTDDPQHIDAIIESGPRVGVATIERILCGGTVEAIGITDDGTPLALGRSTRAIPPSCGASSSTATMAAPPTGASPAIASSPTTSSRGATAAAPTPPTSPRSAGTTTTWSSTAGATASTPAPRPDDGASSGLWPTGHRLGDRLPNRADARPVHPVSALR